MVSNRTAHGDELIIAHGALGRVDHAVQDLSVVASVRAATAERYDVVNASVFRLKPPASQRTSLTLGHHEIKDCSCG